MQRSGGGMGNIKTARVIQDGDHQVIELPPEIQVSAGQMEVSRSGDSVLLRPIVSSWAALVGSLNNFSPDFMSSERHQPTQGNRVELL